MVKQIFNRMPATASRYAVGAALALGVALAGGSAAAVTTDGATQPQPVAQQQNKAETAEKASAVSAQTVLRVAESQIGVKENAAGGGTPFHEWYMKSPRALETLARDGGGTPSLYANAPWCDMFVSWVGEQSGARHTIGWDAYTVTHAKWFKDNGRWGTQARPGAVVFFDWGGSKNISAIDHVGLVKKDNGDGTITTIEGNTGNGKVEERVRPVSQIVGYGYPEYADA
ncbi:MAG TPA: CHAP domain-containing protein [Nonomuraea sp.]|uniref:CHAP domain-containing protein n=1 Tax=Nonomuraea sp. NPDC049649 TaxID=3155776 RepID=UPI002C8DAF77|nr:CHAP domain-containing protein [Nonomuraea sp.]